MRQLLSFPPERQEVSGMAFRKFTDGLRSLFRKTEVDREMDDEVKGFIDDAAREKMKRGMSREQALREARLELGGVERVKEEVRSFGWESIAGNLWRDLRFGARMLRKNPGFTAFAVLMLMLGIGANAAVFSVIEAALLRNLPVEQPNQLVFVDWAGRTPDDVITTQESVDNDNVLSYAIYERLRDENTVFSDLFAYAALGFLNTDTNIKIDGEVSVVEGEMVTGNYFQGLGVKPILGRGIEPSDTLTSTPVAMISYAYWQRRFNRDPNVIGKAILVDRIPYTITGVAPSGFYGLRSGHQPDVWVSMTDDPKLAPFGGSNPNGISAFRDPKWWWVVAVGRLKPGIRPERAQTLLDVYFRQAMISTVDNATKGRDLVPKIVLDPAARGLALLREKYQQPLGLLIGSTALVLLIACANLAGLLLARARARRKEMAMRMAIGASRTGLVGQLLMESVLLVACGAAAGIMLAYWSSRGLAAWMFAGHDAVSLTPELDLKVLAFTIGIAAVTGIVFGILPAVSATRVDVSSAMKETAEEAASGGGRRMSLGNLLVAAQAALAVVLLAGAGLFLRTVNNLEARDLGFNRQKLALFTVKPAQIGYKGERLMNFYGQMLDRVRSLPGVDSASAAQLALVSGWVSSGPVTPEGPKPDFGAKPSMRGYWNGIAPDFLDTMGIKLLLGRTIERRDMAASPRVAVINQEMAERFWGSANPLGRHFSLGSKLNPSKEFQVIGVAQNGVFADLREKTLPTAYIPFTQSEWEVTDLTYFLRTHGDTAALGPEIRDAVHSVDPDLPIFNLKTEDALIEESLGEEHLFSRLLSIFGGLALLLTATGIYGLLAYTVGRRVREIGIRMALGATQGNVLWLIVKRGLVLTALGTSAGIVAALGVTRLLRAFLYGVNPADPATFIAVAALLGAIAALACWLPARRATQLDPMVALRHE
jgi:predicted permease